MSILAIMLDGDVVHYPPSAVTLWLPLLVVFVVWILLGRKKGPVFLSLGLAAVSALVVSRDVIGDVVGKSDVYLEWPNLLIVAVAALALFMAIAFFCFAKQRKPNQAPEPTAPSGRGSS